MGRPLLYVIARTCQVCSWSLGSYGRTTMSLMPLSGLYCDSSRSSAPLLGVTYDVGSSRTDRQAGSRSFVKVALTPIVYCLLSVSGLAQRTLHPHAVIEHSRISEVYNVDV